MLTHDEVSAATAEFLKAGGRINILPPAKTIERPSFYARPGAIGVHTQNRIDLTVGREKSRYESRRGGPPMKKGDRIGALTITGISKKGRGCIAICDCECGKTGFEVHASLLKEKRHCSWFCPAKGEGK